jgi:hypothetical protein
MRTSRSTDEPSASTTWMLPLEGNRVYAVDMSAIRRLGFAFRFGDPARDYADRLGIERHHVGVATCRPVTDLYSEVRIQRAATRLAGGPCQTMTGTMSTP